MLKGAEGSPFEVERDGPEIASAIPSRYFHA
jgi:hypothetical protein